jgi:hypothetical protein
MLSRLHVRPTRGLLIQSREPTIASPHPALVPLAAARPLPKIDDPNGLVRSALEHRVAGLLWTQVSAGRVELGQPWTDELLQEDIRTWGRHQLLWEGLVRVTRRLERMGIGVASAKGVTAEARWYERAGERPCFDADLLLAPDDVGRIGEIVRELMPEHPLRDSAQALVDSGALQSVDLFVEGIHVDLHIDLLKFEIIRSRQSRVIWDRIVPFRLADGTTIKVVDPEISLVHFLVHLNKDRFAYLLGFADIARICAKEQLDWEFIDRFVRAEGIESQVYLALDTVFGTLALSAPAHPPVHGLRAIAWRRLWSPTFRLRGDIGRFTSRHRQFWLAFIARGRGLEATRGYLRRLVPPPALASYQAPGTRGPYLWLITAGKVQSALRRRQMIAKVEETESATAQPRS